MGECGERAAGVSGVRGARAVLALQALAGLAGVAVVLDVLIRVGVAFGLSPGQVVAVGYVAAVTVPLVVTDMREQRLPNALVLPGYAFAATGVVLNAGQGGPALREALAVCALALAVMGALALGGGLGMGDAKLAGMLALALAATGLGAASVIVAGAVSAVSAGITALAVLVGRRGYSQATGHHIPFGPFLLAGFWFAVVTAAEKSADAPPILPT